MKGIILAGGQSNLCYPLADYCRRSLIPFCNDPFVQHQLLALRDLGVQDVGLALSSDGAEAVRERFGDGSSLGIRLTYAVDKLPVGPAGAIRSLGDFIGDDPFVVLGCTTYVGAQALKGLVRAHRDRGATATLGMASRGESVRPSDFENVVLRADGTVASYEILHASRERRQRRDFGGVYVFEPEVLASIPADGHADIKEQLIPELCAEGAHIVAHTLDGPHASIDSTEEYERVQKYLLQQGRAHLNAHVEIGEEIWAEGDARIASTASLLGPIVIGRGCVIEEGARIIGPAFIGDGCHVGAESLVRESTLWPESRVEQDARVEFSIVGTGCAVRRGRRLRRELLMKEHPQTCYRHTSDDEDGNGNGDDGNGTRWNGRIVPVDHPTDKVKSWIQCGAKRLVDVIASALALVMGLPILALITVITKLDSPGPVFFVQRRCGRGGREFDMFKFRTMHVDAAGLQQRLRDQNSVDGPMFKMFDDPRRTRVGRILHETGLDELPQLMNVLRGDMSWVGPRPLVMGEMVRSANWRDFRLTVKPGITGPWQISDRRECSFHDWILHDVDYVRNHSFFGDCEILLKTAFWACARVIRGCPPPAGTAPSQTPRP